MNLLPAILNADGLVQPIVPPDDTTGVSCIWHRVPDGEAFKGSEVCSFKSTHSYGYVLLFKPSLAEVWRAAPKGAEGFFTIDIDPTARHHIEAGVHTATVTVWEAPCP